MNDQSPPKRVTRARAAAKPDTGVKIATAASKAKLTRTTSIKRKTRADDTHEDEENNVETTEPDVPTTTRGRAKKAGDVHKDEQRDEINEMMDQPKTTREHAKKSANSHDDGKSQPKNEVIEPELPKATRGRARRAAVPQDNPEPELLEKDPAPPKPTRGRPKKTIADATAPVSTRATRGRAKKVEVPEEDSVIVVEGPPKRPVRAPVLTVSKATAPKKTVKFEEPDKENVVPLANAKRNAKVAETVTGFKAKPVRKPATATSRATRGSANVEEKEQKSSALSPKKATQVATVKEQGSDDELAINEKTPMKPLMKSPIRAPGSVLGTAKKLDFSSSVTVHRAVGQDFSTSTIASPARRPPQSPFKDSLKTSPQRTNFAGSLMKSPFKLPPPPSKTAEPTSNSDFRASLFQSPPRRPQSPTKVSEYGSPSRSRNTNPMIGGATPKADTFKISRFGTPRTLTKSAARPGQMLPPSAFKSMTTSSSQAKGEHSDPNESSEPSLAFSGRLSSILPGEAEPSLTPSESIIEETEAQPTLEMEQPGEPMAVDQDGQVAAEALDDHTTTPPYSPSRNSTGAFALRELNENPFMDSDSEDELASVSPKYSPGPMNLFASSAATPTPFKAPKTPQAQKSSIKDQSLRRSQIGFTPLARQLSDWMASSPEKSNQGNSDAAAKSPTASTLRAVQSPIVEVAVEPSPAKSTFFEDEMCIRDKMQSVPEPANDVVDDIIIDDRNFAVMHIDEEDLALAEEADEMSLLEIAEIETAAYVGQATEVPINTEEPAFESTQTVVEQAQLIPSDITEDHSGSLEIETMVEIEEADVLIENAASEPFEESVAKSFSEQTQVYSVNEPALSEASQEYGDENVIPIDPVLLALPVTPRPATSTIKTPKRFLAERVCHTVSKVPLKAAAEDSPMRPSPMKRSASISRLPAARPSNNLTRSNTVISYSPTKSSRKTRTQPQQEKEDVIMEEAYTTPSKLDADWSTLGTPARTPRRDLNTALLNGAVVFVDVHTSEGADASSLFTELLTQMGARCVKSWNWNPNSDDGSKIGITHVVFKDGGKRTLEKAKETGGVVTCVGVGWVLDCERDNKWLPESAYAVDTGMVPRGGHRRRKSMEPRALANLNGTLLACNSTSLGRKSMSPMKNQNSFADTPLTSKSRRRDSVEWVRNPSSSSSPNDHEIDDDTPILSPVPATPGPEFISAYGEEGLYGNETPSAQTPYFLKDEQLVQQTAPVNKYSDFEQRGGQGFLSEKKDESVMMRLMAARRKSLQWAPKVGSPLARDVEWK